MHNLTATAPARLTLPHTDLNVSRICLGTMTFGEQVAEADAHAILDRALARGVNFIDAAEMYPVPPSAAHYGDTERIIGNWFASRPGAREQVVLATKAAGPVRGYQWIRNANPDLTAEAIVASCEASLQRLRTEVIDLYQIHWPVRHVPMFGGVYFDPAKDNPALNPIAGQLEGLARLVKAGKVRHIGLSNETPYGVSAFVHAAEQHGLPRIATVQNPYCLVNRVVDNGLDETLWRHQVSLLAYSPLGFGLLTGKYDEAGFSQSPDTGRLARFETMRKQRWARPEALAAARRYNTLARANGFTPTQMALAWCYQRWVVASTIIGVTSVAQLDENLAAWGTSLSAELLAEIDTVRWELRDPAQ